MKEYQHDREKKKAKRLEWIVENNQAINAETDPIKRDALILKGIKMRREFYRLYREVVHYTQDYQI